MGVAIVGMHRSGTSLVAQMLAQAGLYLGRDDDLVPAGPDNPDGYWEHARFHRLNERMLAVLGGGWDNPPEFPLRPRGDARLRPIAADAKRLVVEFRGNEAWGWKDPRTSLTLPVWSDVVRDLKLVVCVRNPLEVAFSLNRRGMVSYPTGLELWRTYYERIVAGSTPEQRIVTEYGAYFARPEPELRRVLRFLGMDSSRRVVDAAASAPQHDLRHARFDVADLRSVQVAPDLVELYEWLVSQADAKSSRTRARSRAPRPSGAPATEPVVDDRAVTELALQRQVHALRPAYDRLQKRVAELEEELARARTREADLERDVERLHTRDREQLAQTLNEVQDSFYSLEVALADGPPTDETAAVRAKRRERLKQIVRAETPSGASIAVVSKGDERLVALYGRRALHFPQTESGVYAGRHPASGLSAIAHLEVVRAEGADYFLVPAEYLWWLEHYAELRRHLITRYRQVAWDSDVCALFALRVPAEAKRRWRAEAVELASVVRGALGRPPTVLDWGTGIGIGDALPAMHAATGQFNGRLPYPDESVDIVALSSSGEDAVAEAERVASAAVFAIPTDSNDCGSADVRVKIHDLSLDVSEVSIVVSLRGNARHAEACLASLDETLPREFGGEIVLVSDARAGDGAADRLGRLAESRERTIVIGSPDTDAPLEAANRGAEAAGENTVVLVDSELLLLPGWLRPLLDVLRANADAGAVGARLLSPDGGLEEAGGTVFSDGAALRFGHGHPDPEAALFSHVRTVDFCSRLLLATRRALFLELGGFDRRLERALQAEVDYCFRLRRRGLGVYYQPASTAVHLEGTAGSTGPDGNRAVEEAGDPRFLRRWRSLLKQQPPRPDVVDLDALQAVAALRA